MHVFMCVCVCVVHAHMYADVEDARCPTLSIFDLSSSLDKGFLTEPGARLGATKSQSPSCPYISKSWGCWQGQGHTQFFVWVFGIKTQVLRIIYQALLLTESSSPSLKFLDRLFMCLLGVIAVS